MKFEYPIQGQDAEALYRINREGKGGFYPIGANYSYHGGMHFEAAGGEDRPVVAIADGEIIAYRYMSDYIKEPKSGSGDTEGTDSGGSERESAPSDSASPEPGAPEGGTSDVESYRYSNCFVLIRHKYKSPQGRKLVFFSLYHHLRPWNDEKWTDAERNKLKIFGTEGYLIKAGNSEGKLGLFQSPGGARVRDTWLNVNDVVPATKHDDVWAKTEDGKYFAHENGTWAEPAEKYQYKITISASENGGKLPLFEGPTTTNKIRGENLSRGDEVIATRINDEWAKTEDGKFFYYAGGYASQGERQGTGPSLDELVCEPVPVKAGDLIGYTGLYEAEGLENHRTVHVEVFAGSDAATFLANAENEGQPTHIKVPNNTRLKKKKYPDLAAAPQFDRMKYTVVEVTDENEGGGWVRVKDKEVAGLVNKPWLNDKYNASRINHYTANDGRLAEIKAVFPGWDITAEDDGHLNESTSATHFYYKWGSGDPANRRIITIDAGAHSKEYWVARASLFTHKGQLSLTDGTTANHVVKVACYEENPDTLENGEKTSEQRTFRIDEVEKLRYDGKLWYGIDEAGGKRWISKEDVKEITPFHWPGFRILDEGRDVSVTEGPVTSVDMRADYEAMPPFFRQIVDRMNGEDEETGTETTGGGRYRVLRVQDIRSALAEEDVARKLSRVICVHPSEWSKEQWDEETSGMEEGERTDKLMRRIEQLCWWEGVKEKITSEAIEGFPDSPMVYHWNPVAFVGHIQSLSDLALTYEELRKVAKYASTANVRKYLLGLNSAIKDAGIDSPLKKAHFLAQVIAESGSLQYEVEGGRKRDGTYRLSEADARDAYGGPPGGGDFRGRGLIQVTFHDNYSAYGAFVGEDFVGSSDATKKLEQKEHAARSAGWYWHKNELNTFAEENDFYYICYLVNGGFNHYEERLSILRHAVSIICPGTDTNYTFSDSRIYKIAKASFGWGLWHDPNPVYPVTAGGRSTDKVFGSTRNRHPATSNKATALEGYKRFIELVDEHGASVDEGWYYGRKDEVNVGIKTFVERRIRELER